MKPNYPFFVNNQKQRRDAHAHTVYIKVADARIMSIANNIVMFLYIFNFFLLFERRYTRRCRTYRTRVSTPVYMKNCFVKRLLNSHWLSTCYVRISCRLTDVVQTLRYHNNNNNNNILLLYTTRVRSIHRPQCMFYRMAILNVVRMCERYSHSRPGYLTVRVAHIGVVINDCR